MSLRTSMGNRRGVPSDKYARFPSVRVTRFPERESVVTHAAFQTGTEPKNPRQAQTFGLKQWPNGVDMFHLGSSWKCDRSAGATVAAMKNRPVSLFRVHKSRMASCPSEE